MRIFGLSVQSIGEALAHVPKWRDIRTLTGGNFYEKTGLQTVDVISGGFPCQPFSVAGKRRGAEDDRYLWPEMLRVIDEIRPTWVVGENVAGIINMALDTVLSDMEGKGYAARTFVIPACATDAAHRRDRVAIVAHASIEGNGRLPVQSWQSRQTDTDTDRRGEDVAHAQRIRLRADSDQPAPDKKRDDSAHRKKWKTELCEAGRGSDDVQPERSGRGSAESGMGGVADGVPAWVDGYWVNEPDIPRIAADVPNRIEKLKALGNAVYWRQFYPIFKFIMEIEKDENRAI